MPKAANTKPLMSLPMCDFGGLVRLFDTLMNDQTCCSVSSNLLTHAREVTSWCEAVRTMHTPIKGNLIREEKRKLQASCGLGARFDGMASICELLLKTVRTNKLKMLKSLYQKVSSQVIPVSSRGTQTLRYRSKGRAYPIILSHEVEEGTLYYSAQAVRTCEGKNGNAGIGLWKKQMPFCNERDKRINTLRESELTSTWSLITREFVELFQERKANGSKSG